jgi:dTDP-glucose 4,6-dehydratase
MKLLVTGGAGFIGSNFIRYWLEKYPNDQIVNLDKLTYAGHISSTKDFENNPNYKFIKGDICDSEIVNSSIKDINIVVNFAAESHVDRSITGPKDFLNTNVLGTQILLDVALKNGIKRFHHISTDEVFGALELDSEDKFNEGTPYNPRSPYSASKAASDHIVRAYYHTYGLPITISNCANNYGPYQDPEKFFARSITNLIEDKPVFIYGDGKYVRDWLYVEDHCSAIDLIINKGKVGETYLVGGLTEDISNEEIAKLMTSHFGKDETYLKYGKDRLGHDRRYAINWTKIKNELGWEPKYDFNNWLVKTIEWYKENEWWWKPLKSEAEELYKKTGQV